MENQVQSLSNLAQTQVSDPMADPGIRSEEPQFTLQDQAPEYILENYPDPFSNETKIKFKVGATAFTTLKVYNSYGYLIRVLFDGQALAGQEYLFTFEGTTHPEGMYILHLQNGSGVTVKEKMLLLK
jgi:hypothetical protein